MTDTEPILIGYLPKLVVKRPEWLKCVGVVDICSASPCTSGTPEDWIEHWLHNELWVLPSEPASENSGAGSPAFSSATFHTAVLPVTVAPGAAVVRGYRRDSPPSAISRSGRTSMSQRSTARLAASTNVSTRLFFRGSVTAYVF
jgi:hypothetical protein